MAPQPLAATAGHLTIDTPSVHLLTPQQNRRGAFSQFACSWCSAGLRPGTEYGMGVTAVTDERESLPTTTNAVTGQMFPPTPSIITSHSHVSAAANIVCLLFMRKYELSPISTSIKAYLTALPRPNVCLIK